MSNDFKDIPSIEEQKQTNALINARLHPKTKRVHLLTLNCIIDINSVQCIVYETHSRKISIFSVREYMFTVGILLSSGQMQKFTGSYPSSVYRDSRLAEILKEIRRVFLG